MSRDEIMRMADESGLTHPMNCISHGVTERFAVLVAAKEREDILRMSESQFFKTQAEYDDAIRARGRE